MNKDTEVKLDEGTPSGKAYAGPQLVIYGNISRITEAVAKNSKTADGGGPTSNNKTA